MGKRRRAGGNNNINPWLSARMDCKEGRFIQVGNSLLLSHKDDTTGLEPWGRTGTSRTSWTANSWSGRPASWTASQPEASA